QTTTIDEYQNQFEKLSNKVIGLSEDWFISTFVSGLWTELRRKLLVAQPVSLMQAMSLAKMQEKDFLELQKYLKPSWPKVQVNGGISKNPTVTITTSTRHFHFSANQEVFCYRD
ncbi:hypothetical protein CFOL_v3_35661, partial [Cephalotus follicularis]